MRDPGDALAGAALTALREEVEALRLAVRARDDFIAITAHELRNPMTPILGVTELALRAARDGEPCSPRVLALLERLEGLVHDFVNRTTSLLDVTRIEAGNLRLTLCDVKLGDVLRSVALAYGETAARGGSLLELDIEERVGGLWDRLAVEQVIDNLLSNAIKYGMGRPVTLRLRSRDGWAMLEVQDRGGGMNADQQARIFARFEQVVTQHRGPGFGLGLWVASRLAGAMGGRITVASRLDEGSVFTLLLPMGSVRMTGSLR